jgi:hypothetical protein
MEEAQREACAKRRGIIIDKQVQGGKNDYLS